MTIVDLSLIKAKFVSDYGLELGSVFVKGLQDVNDVWNSRLV